MVNGCIAILGRKGITSAEPERIRLLLLHNDRWRGLRAGAEGDFVVLRLASHLGRTLRGMSCFELGI